MLYPELNGPIGLSPEYKRLILPNFKVNVKAYFVRSEIFSGLFFFISKKTTLSLPTQNSVGSYCNFLLFALQ